MRSMNFTDWLLTTACAFLTLPILGQNRPLWLYVAIPAIVLLIGMMFDYKPNCSKPLFSIAMFFSNWIMFYWTSGNNFQSFLISLSIVTMMNALKARSWLTWIFLIVLGTCFGFSQWMGKIRAVLVFLVVIILILWIKAQIKRQILIFFLIFSSLISFALLDLRFSPIQYALKQLPENTLQEESVTVQIKPIERINTKVERSEENAQKDFGPIVEKVFFPITLTLFGIFLFTLSLKLFKLKGTLMLLVVGATSFALIVSLFSLIFSLIKPRIDFSNIQRVEAEPTQQTPQQNVQFVESTPTLLSESERNARGAVNFLNWLSLILLIFSGVFMIYLTFYTATSVRPLVSSSKPNHIETSELSSNESSLKFETSERFVAEAYWWFRRKYFPGLHHLTPYEILNLKSSSEAFRKLTDTYVSLRYANKKLEPEEIRNFYTNLLEICDLLEKDSPQEST